MIYQFLKLNSFSEISVHIRYLVILTYLSLMGHVSFKI